MIRYEHRLYAHRVPSQEHTRRRGRGQGRRRGRNRFLPDQKFWIPNPRSQIPSPNSRTHPCRAGPGRSEGGRMHLDVLYTRSLILFTTQILPPHSLRSRLSSSPVILHRVHRVRYRYDRFLLFPSFSLLFLSRSPRALNLKYQTQHQTQTQTQTESPTLVSSI